MFNEEKTIKEFGYNLDKAKTHSQIWVICDYCNKEITKKKNDFLNSRNIIEKDCCKDKFCKNEKFKESSLKKYGKDNPAQALEVSKKISNSLKNQTPEKKLETQNKKEQTSFENFGVRHPMQHKYNQNKKEQTNIKIYGFKVPTQNSQIKQKIKDTKANTPQEKKIETRNKIEQTNLDVYGFKNPTQNKDVQKKREKTIKDLFGEDNASKNPQIKQKISDSLKNLPKEKKTEIRNRIEQTNLDVYGFKNPTQNKEVANKISFTLLQRSEEELKKVNDKILNTKIKNNKPLKYGQTQNQVCEWVNSLGFNFKRFYLDGREIDIYDKNTNLAIEYCGLYWHNELSYREIGQFYHYNKWINCKNNNINLLTIFEDEWKFNQNICKNYIKSNLGLSKNKYIININENFNNINFIKENSLFYNSNIVKIFNLYDLSELIGVITIDSNGYYKIIPKLGYNICNLLDYYNYIKDYILILNNRWEFNNFNLKLLNIQLPSFKFLRTIRPLAYKHRLDYIDNYKNYTKIWDCGFSLFRGII